MITLLIIFGIFGLVVAGIIVLCCMASDDVYEEYYRQDYECPACGGWAVAFHNGKDKKTGGVVIRIECLECGHYEDIVVPKKGKNRHGPNQM